MTAETVELSSFFDETDFAAPTFNRYADAAHTSFAARERFDQLLREYEARVQRREGDALKLALGLLILGRFTAALEWFARAPEGPVRHFYAAEAALALDRFDEAIQEFREAARAGWNGLKCDLRIAAALVRAGRLEEAEKLLARHESDGAATADWHYVRGRLAEARYEHVAAGEAYERALQLDPEHTQALFRCARLYDLWGNDEAALELYDRLTRQPRAYVNALLNAAVLYEERGDYESAQHCVRRVLKAYPNHRRARLYFKSVEGCRRMVIDEAGAERVDARARLLATPLTEFELSIRARNCLKKMNIRTLGDLIRHTEEELLAYKNFGETSLAEIKALLARKGLRFGMRPDDVTVEPASEESAPARPALPPEQEAVLAKPVSELELSVRSRRCLQRLNVVTLGDLVRYSEADLLATRNFGVTSLNEIKSRLAEFGLQLAPKKAT